MQALHYSPQKRFRSSGEGSLSIRELDPSFASPGTGGASWPCLRLVDRCDVRSRLHVKRRHLGVRDYVPTSVSRWVLGADFLIMQVGMLSAVDVSDEGGRGTTYVG
jgi:hypothetical protein